MSAGRTIVGLAAVAVACAACGPTAPTLDLRLAASASEVPLGGPVTFTATLSNASGSTVEVKPLALDTQSLSLVLAWRPVGAAADAPAREGLIRRIVPTAAMMPSPLPTSPLAAGQSVECKFTLPLVHAGEVRVRARYAGAATAGRPGDIESAPIQIAVTAGPERLLGARLETDLGPIDVQLLPDAAPGTVTNFCDLARTGWFDGTEFSRVVAGFVVQGGAKPGNPMASPGWTIPAEFNDTLHAEGTLSMARQAVSVDTGCTEFFVCLGRTENHRNLDAAGGFPCTAFGRVLNGMELVRAIVARPVVPGPGGENSRPVQPVAIRRVSIFAR